MQIEKMYDELCELYQQQKQIFVKINNCCLKKDLDEWNSGIKEFNHITRKIQKHREVMSVLRDKNIEEQAISLRKHFNVEEE